MAAARKLRLKDKRRRVRYVILVISGLLLVGALVGGVYLLRSPEVNIASVTVTGSNYTSEDLVLQMVRGMLNGSYVYVIPRTNIFLYPKTAIKREIHSIFPTVKETSFSRNGFTGITVSLIEREPSALWCQSSSSTSPCYLLDQDGFIFTKSYSNNDQLVTYYGGLAGEPLASIFYYGRYNSLNKFVNDVSLATNRDPVSVSVDENDDISITFSEGGELRFANKNANDALLDNIASVFASRRFQSEERLDYADFRFGNKIYVKFLGEQES